ncbi:ATP-grasp domain-containing protein [Neorhodopirellula lusitana]|uniref:ATP-grasp domain-containing protein n=1 Tax=Neorhodopirellula lusitana TaxID=445327 RepID=UPI00384EB1FE
MTRRSILVLGGRDPHSPQLGWHLSQLKEAAKRRAADISFLSYDALRGDLSGDLSTRSSEVVGSLNPFDAILTRTMPMGSFEQVLFRLSVLHDEYERRKQAGTQATICNPPAALEIAIDKFATLARGRRLGIPVPPTAVVQSRAEAMEAFEVLGGDVVVKPIFGGEGRGVMRLQNRELAWTAFSVLSQVGSVLYIQQFIPPGGRDIRILVLGDQVFAIRRTSGNDFRTNVKAGGKSERIELDDHWRTIALQFCDSLQLRYAAVDLIESENGNGFYLIEVNAIPGWKSAQSVMPISIADQIVSFLLSTTHSV